MLIVLNFILRAFKQKRDRIRFDCNVENILERGKTQIWQTNQNTLSAIQSREDRTWSQVMV